MSYIHTALFLKLFLVSVSFYCSAQTAIQQSISHFNQFQRATSEKHENLDSAFYSATQLSLENTELLNFLLHDSFAYRFTISAQADTTFARTLLQKLYTANAPLQQSTKPLYQWVTIKNNLSDAVKIRQITNEFIADLAHSAEEKQNRIDRYALLIYRSLRQNPAYVVLADTLFNRTRQRLEHAVNGFYYQQTDDRNQRAGRAYYRYLMACIHKMQANEAINQHNATLAESHLKEASQFSPDDTDRMASSAYFYEAAFLENNREDFREDYVKFLLAKGDTTTAVNVLTELTLVDPGNLPLLKTYYQKTSYAKTPFETYWQQKLNEKLKLSGTFQLTDLDGKVFDYEKLRGKWILIDFWGTWCKPCVEELPRFQKFYSDHIKAGKDNLVVFTAASHDLEPNVREFMKKHAYTFPVVMANDALIKQFRVGEYPTKVVITPQGNRMKIPFATNWVERVKIYTEN